MVTAAGVLVAGAAACVASLGFATPGAAAPADDPEALAVSASVDGLYPGARATMQVHIDNHRSESVVITAVDVTPGPAAAACPGTLLEFSPLAATVEIAAGAGAPVPIGVHLSRDAPDACQGATWPLAIVARAVGSDGVAEGPLPGPGPGPGAVPVPVPGVVPVPVPGAVPAPLPGPLRRPVPGPLPWTGWSPTPFMVVATGLVAIGTAARRIARGSP